MGNPVRKTDPRTLDYDHAEFILIGAKKSPEKELDIKFDVEKESVDQSELVKELELQKGKKRLEFIEEGKWD